MENNKKEYARLLHQRHFSNEYGFDIASIFKLRGPSGRGAFERGISLIDKRCAEERNGEVCRYVKANADTYGGLAEGCVFWVIDAKRLPPNWIIEESENNCHAELIISPEHNQDAIVFRKNNEDLLRVIGEIYNEKDVYICVDGKPVPFNKRDFLRATSAIDTYKNRRKKEKKISKFQNFIK